MQFRNCGEMYADMGLSKLAEHVLRESEHQREHARTQIQCVLFLEGQPNLGEQNALVTGVTVVEMLKARLEDPEIDHACLLEKQLRPVEMVGLQDYLEWQLGTCNPTRRFTW
jgi:bacterioferritin